MADLEELLSRSAALHSHLCPRQVLGVRAGLLAARIFEMDLPQRDKRLFAFVETDGCFADGVSVASGCTLGRRTLRLVDFGKVAVTFTDTLAGASYRIAPSPYAREQACLYAPGEPSSWHAQLAAYKVMPDVELLRVDRVALGVSLDDIISKPGLRVQCALCGEEVMNGREMYRDGEALCRACAEPGPYYRAESD